MGTKLWKNDELQQKTRVLGGTTHSTWTIVQTKPESISPAGTDHFIFCGVYIYAHCQHTKLTYQKQTQHFQITYSSLAIPKSNAEKPCSFINDSKVVLLLS